MLDINLQDCVIFFYFELIQMPIHINGIVLFLNRNPNKPFCVLNFFQRHTYKTTRKRKGNDGAGSITRYSGWILVEL